MGKAVPGQLYGTWKYLPDKYISEIVLKLASASGESAEGKT